MWTFGRRIAAGFGLSFLLLLVIGTVAYKALSSTIATTAWITHTREVLERNASLLALLQEAEASQRGFVITGEEPYLQPYNQSVPQIAQVIVELRKLTADNPQQQKRLDQVEPMVTERLTQFRKLIELRRTAGHEAAVKAIKEGEGKRTMDDLRRLAKQVEAEEVQLLKQRSDENEAATSGARYTIIFGTLLALLVILGAGTFITRSLGQNIGGAVAHVQSSSAELQAAANQQATGARETSTSMNEITTTISELLATSRQIAQSAQRVAAIAAETAGAARSGDQTAVNTHDAVLGIKRQVDTIVTHMLELGKKSQQIGSVLEIINELAEQTNILSINASIEAAGAGEAGKRFAVVAEEIRKLADRVAGSTREIRSLIEEIRSAVNTTVMATEAGTKAADSGARQFGEVMTALKQISGLVSTTTDAAKEIELSTKQQATAVEQVNLAIANVAQASKETETSSTQTLQTATTLSKLSRELGRLITAEKQLG